LTAELLALRLLAPAEAPPPAEPATSKPVPSEEAIAREGDLRLDAKRKRKFKRSGSPQRFEFEFKMGPYLPDVDRKYDGPGLGPYATIFGETNSMGLAVDDPKQFPMPAVAFEWQFVYLAGPLALAAQIGLFRDRAQALLTTPMEGDTSLRSSADEVIFGLVPIALQIGYRFEYGADRFRIPLVPYAKFGPAYGFWWTKEGSGKIARDSRGNRGSGGVWGFQLNTGLMLRLDFIEPGTSKKLDQVTGINHTYIFGEYQLSRLDNFGIGDAIEVGDSTFFVGLAIEF
jgi:hypothetical protein